MTDIKIIPYHPDNAASVADMWNRSSAEWGGGTSVRTAEQVRHSEANSDALALFLAVMDEEVIGYCSIGEYREDAGTLFIQLLNVRPDYHGHKLGKRLVLRAVEEAIALERPRIDLYTWGANLKAVPLYKRCGFFWEDQDDSVHFMNFIPQVAACEAIQPYFAQFDWYADLVRAIEMKPDGEKQNGFETYSYVWKKETKQALRIDIERRSRGICYVETDDYILATSAEQAEPVCGFRYRIKYRVVNKTNKPLRIQLQGESNEHISFDWQHELLVVGEQEISSNFFVNEMKEVVNVRRTCPAVQTRVSINGLELQLQVGLMPKFPAKIQMHVPTKQHRLNRPYTLYIDIQNQFNVPAAFSFDLPDDEWLQLEQQTFHIQLQAKEKASIAVSYRLSHYGFYRVEPVIHAVPVDGGEASFSYVITGEFVGPGAMVAGEANDYWVVWNGKYSISYDKERNEVFYQANNRKPENIQLLTPLLGRPYSNELTRKKPMKVQIIEEDYFRGIRHTYQPDSFPQLLLHVCTALQADGTVRVWHELENHSTTEVNDSIWLAQRIYWSLYRLVMPYDGEIMELTNSQGSKFEYWDATKVDEPWLFTRGDETPYSITWSSNQHMRFGNWFIEIENSINSLQPGERRKLDEIFLSIGGFGHWEEFRAYAMQSTEPNYSLKSTRHMELTVAGNNPFLPSCLSEVMVELKDAKQNIWNGEVTISYADRGNHVNHENQSDRTVERRTFADDVVGEISCSLPAVESTYSVVQVETTIGSQLETHYRALFALSSTPVALTRSTEGAHAIYVADNGIIQLSVAENHYPTLHSLTACGREWLASGFPEFEPKSWWNPWIGGMYYSLGSMSPAAIRREQYTVSSVEMPDSKGNTWSGIRTRQVITKYDAYQGTTIDNYYLLLPGAPIVVFMMDICQNSGVYMEERLRNELFLRMDEAHKGWLRTFSPAGEALHYIIGNSDISVTESQAYGFGWNEDKGVMQIVTDENVNRPAIYSNREVSNVTISTEVRVPQGQVFRTQPIYLVFTDELLPTQSFEALRQIAFPIADEGN